MNRLIALAALLLAPLAGLSATDGLVVYPPVPGLAASEHYKVRVRSAREWQSVFAWETVCEFQAIKRDSCEFAWIRGYQP